MNIIVAGIIGLFTLLNVSSYFVLASRIPQYTVFLGTVHYPADYLYYLSFITQGGEHWFRSYHLFTGETTKLEFLNWMYVFMGHLGSLIGLDTPTIYQVFVVIGSICYLVIAYKLATILIPKFTHMRLMLFVLFLLSNAYPNIYIDKGTWIFTYYYPFNNLGHPFLRLSNTPHHMMIQAAIMAVCFFSISYWQKQKARFLVGTLVTGFVLGSIQPLQWAFMTGILGVSGIFAWWKNRKILSIILPAGAFFVGGIVPAQYLQALFSTLPYVTTVAWENQQQVNITFWHFIRLNGPLLMIAIVGLPFIIRTVNVASFPLIFYSVIAVILFFSGIPAHFRLLNLRFISVLLTFAAAYVTTELLWNIARVFDPKRTAAFAWLIAIVVMAITIPVTVTQLYERTRYVGTDDLNAYLPLGAFQTFNVARRTVGPTETVLVEPLFASSFPAMTGKHEFVSNPLSTIDYKRKMAETTAFYYGTWSAEEKTAWLTRNNISYIFSYAWVPIDLPNLQIIHQNQYAIFYKILK